MRLDELWIEDFKNFRNARIEFDEESPYTVLIGENGAGKSNLIEAIAWIFRALDLDEPASFGYEIKYRCRDNDVRVKAAKGHAPLFWAKSPSAKEYQEISKIRFMAVDPEDRPLYRPAFVFGYYSGPSDRLSVIFEKHRERFYRLIIQPSSKRQKRPVRSNALRRLFYSQTLHGQFALLAFFMNALDSERDLAFLRQHLQIEDLDSVLFVLKRPPWRRSGGDPRFWNAEGEVRTFLGKLFDAALLPMRMQRRIPVDLAKNPSVENLYLFLPGTKALEEVFKGYDNQYAFFTALESTHISKLLAEVRTRVRTSEGAGKTIVTYRDLSEGEQQLLLVLGLLKFTAEDEALFLLDEPDTHLNPAWSVQYLEFLNFFISRRESCHIVMSTHDPLVFSRLRKSEVRILRRDAEGVVRAEEPEVDPQGMGVQAILTSDLFRLRTTLDAETQRDLDRQRFLSFKKDELSEEEDKELRDVSERLYRLGFTHAQRDPLYQLFLQKWTAREKPEWSLGAALTREQYLEQQRLASEIAGELAQERGSER